MRENTNTYNLPAYIHSVSHYSNNILHLRSRIIPETRIFIKSPSIIIIVNVISTARVSEQFIQLKLVPCNACVPPPTYKI